MNKLEMQIQSIDVRYDSNPNVMYYNLSCSLLNIYKGRCDLFLVNSNTNLKQELLIKQTNKWVLGKSEDYVDLKEMIKTQIFNKDDISNFVGFYSY